MDRQIRFNEEVSKKLANLGRHFEKLIDLLEEIDDHEDIEEIKFTAKDARSEVDKILIIMNQVLCKLDDRE